MNYPKVLFSLGFVLIIVSLSFGQYSFGDTIVATTTGVETTVPESYFKMGDLRLIYNNWGSKSLGCNTPYRVFIEQDSSFGWEFTRGQCGGNNSAPDYPEIEFGQHPFGFVKDSAKPQDLSSTTLLPLQIKDIKSASIKIDQLNMQLINANSWNICFETWLTEKDPMLIDTGECPYAEIMMFWGWQDGRWACDQTGALTAGSSTYDFCHRVDDWSCGWRYIQFRVQNGPMRSYTGTLDVKAMLDWMVLNMGYSQDLWVTRFEIGSEIGDNTSGKLSIKNLTFEVNGQAKSPEFRDPTPVREAPRTAVAPKPDLTVFPSGTTVEIVNMQGQRKLVPTGLRPKTAAELGAALPKGVYLMYGTNAKGRRSGNAVVVPVVR
jgi:hypothetical protein